MVHDRLIGQYLELTTSAEALTENLYWLQRQSEGTAKGREDNGCTQKRLNQFNEEQMVVRQGKEEARHKDHKEKQCNEQGTEGIAIIGGTNVKTKKHKKEQEKLGDKTVQPYAQRQRMINKRSLSTTPQVIARRYQF